MRRSLSLAVLFLFFAFAALPSFAQQACQNALQDVRPTSFHFDPSGGNGTIVVVLSVNGCNWGASSQNDWITLHAPYGGHSIRQPKLHCPAEWRLCRKHVPCF